MVVDRHIEQLPSVNELPRKPQIFPARRGVAARVVVSEDQRGGALAYRRPEYLTRMD
jgi:hypothetical protein